MSDYAAVLLAAGRGSRLAPLSDAWPKCLMPVQGRPLLDYWMSSLKECGVRDVYVNTHTHAQIVTGYLARPAFETWVTPIPEEQLLGTAGTVRAIAPLLPSGPVIVAHADNLCQCDFAAFLAAHQSRPSTCVITMMTFTTATPSTCGILQVERDGIVTAMDEKPQYPVGDLANAAVYIFEPEVVDFIRDNEGLADISNDVLPHFMGRILAWHNHGVLRDIGTPAQLSAAQMDTLSPVNWPPVDEWQMRFEESGSFGEIRGCLDI